MKTSNIRCRKHVENKTEFKGSNLFAESNDKWYVVYSYGYHFPMYACNLKSGKWFGNSDRYSVTTSKHQNQSRPYAEDIQYVDTATLKRIISE